MCAAKWWTARARRMALRRIRALETQLPDHSDVMGLAQAAREALIKFRDARCARCG